MRKTLLGMFAVTVLSLILPLICSAGLLEWNQMSTITSPVDKGRLQSFPVQITTQFNIKAKPSSFRAWLNGKEITGKFQDLAMGKSASVGPNDGLRIGAAGGRVLDQTNFLITEIRGFRKEIDVDLRTFSVKTEAVATINSQGGTIEVTDPLSDAFGVKITVPIAAVTQNTLFSVEAVPEEAELPLLPAFQTVVSPIIEFNSSVPFVAPVEICLPIGSQGQEDYNLYTLDEASGIWVRQNTTSLVPADGKVCSPVTHFSTDLVARGSTCDAPGARRFYNNMQGSCTRQWRLAIYSGLFNNLLSESARSYDRAIAGAFFQNEAVELGVDLFQQTLAFGDALGMKNPADYIMQSIGGTQALFERLLGDEYLSIYLQALFYAADEAIKASANSGNVVNPSIYFSLGADAFRAASNFLNAWDVGEIIERRFEVVIAQIFLARYYTCAADLDCVKTRLGLGSDANRDDMINTIAQEMRLSNTWYSEDYELSRVGDLIDDTIKGVDEETVKYLAAPTTPANLTASPLSQSEIYLAWTPSTALRGVVGYNVYNDHGVLIGTAVTPNYRHANLVPSTQNCYSVSAYTVRRGSSRSNTVCATTLPVPTQDSVSPHLVSSIPSNGQTNVSVTQRTVSFTFSEPMTHPGNYGVTWSGLPAGMVVSDGVWSADAKTITFTFSLDLLPGRAVGWVLNPSTHPPLFKDLAGNPLPADIQGSFSTRVVTLSPIVSVTPSFGTNGTIFDEPGSGFTPNSTATLHFIRPGLPETTLPKITDSNGAYTNTWTCVQCPVGQYWYWAVDSSGVLSNQATFTIY
jgi:hypothetical protein